MCIRDSNNVILTDTELSGLKTELTDKWEYYIDPVSYTHLDVYKRQMYDVQVYSRYNDVYEEENLPQDSYEIITEFLTEHKIDTVYDLSLIHI